MNYLNYHTHSDFCDGKNTIEENIISAIDKGITQLGFSSHAPVSFNPKWTMRKERYDDYIGEIERCAVKYSDSIKLFKGLEVDYIPGVISPNHEFILSKKLDYVIGAVHVIGLPGKNMLPITGDTAKFKAGVEKYFNSDIDFSVREYFRLYRKMILDSPPDICAHIDLIKKINVDFEIFDDSSSWYLKEVDQTLEVVKNSNSIIEINTGALTRKKAKEIFPSDYFLKQMLKLDIPIVLNSDSHSCRDIAGFYPQTLKKLKSMGFNKMKKLVKRGKWEDFLISDI